VGREDERAHAGGGAGLPAAGIVALEQRGLLLEPAEDRARDVVAAVAARALAAWDQEEGRRMLDDDASDVRSLGDADVAALLGNLQAE
jgi:hypothetical protein